MFSAPVSNPLCEIPSALLISSLSSSGWSLPTFRLCAGSEWNVQICPLRLFLWQPGRSQENWVQGAWLSFPLSRGARLLGKLRDYLDDGVRVTAQQGVGWQRKGMVQDRSAHFLLGLQVRQDCHQARMTSTRTDWMCSPAQGMSAMCAEEEGKCHPLYLMKTISLIVQDVPIANIFWQGERQNLLYTSQTGHATLLSKKWQFLKNSLSKYHDVQSNGIWPYLSRTAHFHSKTHFLSMWGTSGCDYTLLWRGREREGQTHFPNEDRTYTAQVSTSFLSGTKIDHQYLVSHESAWFYFPPTSHPHLPNSYPCSLLL